MHICVKSTLPYNHKLKTLIHEKAHKEFFLNGSDKNLTRDEQEIKAESVAYLVCTRLGIDVEDYSSEYLAAWGGNQELVSKKINNLGTQIIEMANLVESLYTESKCEEKKAA